MVCLVVLVWWFCALVVLVWLVSLGWLLCCMRYFIMMLGADCGLGRV